MITFKTFVYHSLNAHDKKESDPVGLTSQSSYSAHDPVLTGETKADQLLQCHKPLSQKSHSGWNSFWGEAPLSRKEKRRKKRPVIFTCGLLCCVEEFSKPFNP